MKELKQLEKIIIGGVVLNHLVALMYKPTLLAQAVERYSVLPALLLFTWYVLYLFGHRKIHISIMAVVSILFNFFNLAAMVFAPDDFEYFAWINIMLFLLILLIELIILTIKKTEREKY